MNFIQVYDEDLIYAAENACNPEEIYSADKQLLSVQSTQAVFNEARYRLGMVSVPMVPLPTPSADAGPCKPAPSCKMPPEFSCEQGKPCVPEAQ
jgi:hypothetical protein